ncbi:DUF421 domain-containing protein [Fredinandcohnia sp. QZ13]|uniref:DUF421 domain-containing protein n=1 Tax=Fredinandcohnia sp. QZ13 TaxID=3073144 RepID=UPI0028532F50|nr:DUF421 domain-containing protein [Fredinandcohnia sp. QZ13]MDR4889578.1 DUF421 domain-containing protein [Fredinandcohnia sp. QZ13]
MELEFWSGAKDLPVWGFLIRAFIVYLYIFIVIKVLGQRSIGTINPLDFLFGIIIGDVIGNPLSSGDIPLAGPLAAATLITILHLGLSYIALKTPRFRRIIEDEPLILIKNGQILKKQLRRTKLTVESLLMDLRLRGTSDLNQIDYAVLESNGQISVIRKSNEDMVTPRNSNLPPQPPKGYPSVLILDGKVVHKNLEKVGTLSWLKEKIAELGFKEIDEIFLLTIDEGGQFYYSKM